MKTEKIGWIGLGNIGTQLIIRLLNEGYTVEVYARSPIQLAKLKNKKIRIASSIKELVDHCDTIFTSVSNDESVKDVYSNFAKHNLTGKLFVDLTTISPETAKAVALLCAAKGGSYLEARISGSVKTAIEGYLIIMVGGDISDYERTLPIFEKLGRLILFLGDVDYGSSAKLAANYLLAVITQGIAETVLFAEKNGISRELMMRIINDGMCGTRLSKSRTKFIVEDVYPAGFPLAYMVKDLKLVRDHGIKTPLSGYVLKSFTDALEKHNLGNEDFIAIIKSLSSQSTP